MKYTVPIELVVDAKRANRETKMVTLGSTRSNVPERQDPVRVPRVRRHDAGTSKGVSEEGREIKLRSAC